METPQQYCALSEGQAAKAWARKDLQRATSAFTESVGLGCTIGCLVWEGDDCDQYKQISEGRTELHVEWTHAVLRGGPIISCDLCSSLFPQENGSA